MRITNIEESQNHTWDIEVNDVHEYFLSNGCVSHNTSGKSVNAVESIDPIHDFFYKEEGTMIIPTVVPNFRQNASYYKRSYDCNQFGLVKNAAVRQKWIDQTQSTTLYIKRPDSLDYMTKLHIYGFINGVKTFYYLKQEKETNSYECESCT